MAREGEAEDAYRAIRALPRGTEIDLTTHDGHHFRGTLVPPHELSGERIIQLKLASGYNIGIRVGPHDRWSAAPPEPASELPTGEAAPAAPPRPPSPGRWVAILTTGGTIASRVDYRTGGVRPVHEEAEILRFYPDLDRDGPVRVLPVFDRLSEEIVPADWATLAEHVARMFQEGATGVVVAHGTDTLAYTAAALSFALDGLPGPVVVVGAQRSPDRPSSDGSGNLLAATEVARNSGLGEVVVVMHAGLSDDRFAIHRATRVRKMHSSRRDAFRSRNGGPIGWLEGRTIHLEANARKATGGPVRADTRFDPHGGLLWFYPGLSPERAEAYVDGLRGVILSGTGLGHVSSAHIPWIRRAVGRGAFIGMTTQCLEGEADPFVYATGRELLRAGVTYLDDLLPETAYVKLLFALGRARDAQGVAEYLRQDQAGEYASRRPAEAPP